MTQKGKYSVDNWLQNSATHAAVSINEEDWQKMKLLLQKNKKRRFIFWWLLLSLLILISGFLGLHIYNKKNEPKFLLTKLKSEKNQKDNTIQKVDNDKIMIDDTIQLKTFKVSTTDTLQENRHNDKLMLQKKNENKGSDTSLHKLNNSLLFNTKKLEIKSIDIDVIDTLKNEHARNNYKNESGKIISTNLSISKKRISKLKSDSLTKAIELLDKNSNRQHLKTKKSRSKKNLTNYGSKNLTITSETADTSSSMYITNKNEILKSLNIEFLSSPEIIKKITDSPRLNLFQNEFLKHTEAASVQLVLDSLLSAKKDTSLQKKSHKVSAKQSKWSLAFGSNISTSPVKLSGLSLETSLSIPITKRIFTTGSIIASTFNDNNKQTYKHVKKISPIVGTNFIEAERTTTTFYPGKGFSLTGTLGLGYSFKKITIKSSIAFTNTFTGSNRIISVSDSADYYQNPLPSFVRINEPFNSKIFNGKKIISTQWEFNVNLSKKIYSGIRFSYPVYIKKYTDIISSNNNKNKMLTILFGINL